ncbi:MAG: orotidine-5'-phosphate decarboxylase [Cytophagales bacterium]|nr:MAG: orotidine-5'-phosphate decarboxylase [Cytophagales bacterium]
MTLQELYQQIIEKKTLLCVGLDTDVEKLPARFPKNAEGMLLFNQYIIEKTAPYCVAYKINTAFYEALGSEGWQTLEQTLQYIPPHIFTIADAKRGDIGNTVEQYAKAFFERMNFDAITVAPYMGQDSATAFLQYPEKYTILLALTSNESAQDFQFIEDKNSPYFLYEKVIIESQKWQNAQNIMYVVGATRPEYLQKIRQIAPDAFLLVPGVGAQGGDLAEVVKMGLNAQAGLLINVSRAIIYANEVEKAAQDYQQQMQKYF